MTTAAPKDIVIVGAGLIGTAAALALGEKTARITLLETHLPDILTQSPKTSRPISLSFGSIRILQSLGVWSALEKAASPILHVHVSEAGKFGATHFSAKKQNVPALGFVVPFHFLQKTLYEKVASTKNITIKSIQTIEHIKTNETSATLAIKTAHGDETIRTDLLIAADGTHSTCRQLLHIKTIEKISGDNAKIFTLTLSESHAFTAYERFTKRGVLAILPLPDQYKAQLVWTTHEKNDDDLLPFLQNIFEGRLNIKNCQKIAEFPLKTIIAEKQTLPSFVLLGNAAHTIYPVAAQGFNLGLRDVSVLRDCNLGEYEQRVQKHQQIIYKITSELIGVFELPLIGCVRGLGLLGMDLVKPLKNRLAKRLMGI